MNYPEVCRKVEKCRVCGGGNFLPFLDLGEMPLVNRYLSRVSDKETEPRFPLQILLCKSCSLSQLSVVIDPKVLFSEYDYYSSVSRTFQAHCDAMAESLRRNLPLGEKDLVVEIASNDGCLLSKFRDRGLRVRGVEPAANLATAAEAKGLPTFAEFWSAEVARKIEAVDGKATVVVATNVLAHVDDLNGFIGAVASLLGQNGVFVFEVPYMVHFLDRTEFDTTYHEHLSYFLLKPLKYALEANGMMIVKAEEFPIHGGTIRVTAQLAAGPRSPDTSADTLIRIEQEKGLYEADAYCSCAARVKFIRHELDVFVRGLKSSGKTIAAYGASAKGNILLNYCGLGVETIDFVVDDTPAKQGKYYPGNHLPIVSRQTLFDRKPDYLLLLAWNFAEELMKNTAEYGEHGGRYIIPIPSLQVTGRHPEKKSRNKPE